MWHLFTIFSILQKQIPIISFLKFPLCENILQKTIGQENQKLTPSPSNKTLNGKWGSYKKFVGLKWFCPFFLDLLCLLCEFTF
jgi:hypothetical protein